MRLHLRLQDPPRPHNPNLLPHQRLRRRQRHLIIHLLRTTHSRHIHGRTLLPLNNRISRLITHPPSPQIINIPRTLHLRRGALRPILPEDIGQRGVHLAGGTAAVQEDDDLVAAAERAAVQLDLAVGHVVPPDADGAGGLGVLGDGEHGGVLLDGEGGGVDGRHDVCHEEGGFQRCPEGEVRDGFVVGETAVADLCRCRG